MISSAEIPGDVYLKLQEIEQFHVGFEQYLKSPELYPGYFTEIIERFLVYKQSDDMQILEATFIFEEFVRENIDKVVDGDGLFLYFQYFETKYPSHIPTVKISQDALDILKLSVLRKSQFAMMQLAYYILQGDVFKPDYHWISWALQYLKQGAKGIMHAQSSQLLEGIVEIQDKVLEGQLLRHVDYLKLRPWAHSMFKKQLESESQFKVNMTLTIPKPSIYPGLSTIEEELVNEAAYQF